MMREKTDKVVPISIFCLLRVLLVHIKVYLDKPTLQKLRSVEKKTIVQFPRCCFFPGGYAGAASPVPWGIRQRDVAHSKQLFPADVAIGVLVDGPHVLRPARSVGVHGDEHATRSA